MVVKMSENEWKLFVVERHSAKRWKKNEKKSELVDLCKKAVTMKRIKIASSAKNCEELLKKKSPTSEGKFPAQKSFIARTYHVSFLSF